MFGLINAIISFIQDLFEQIFFSSSPAYQRKKQLRPYVAEIKKLTPPLYRNDKTILPAFALLLYRLRSFLQPVKAVFEKTINAPDIRTSEKYQSMFFEALLSEEQKKQRRQFDFQERNKIVLNSKNYEDAERHIQQQIQEFKGFTKIFQEPSFKDREQDLINLFYLSDLCNFDYTSFLAHFNKELKFTQEEAQSISQNNFEEVFAEEITKNLLDFQFIIQHVSIMPAMIDNLLFLAKNLDDFTDETGSALEKTLQAAENILANQLKRTSIPIILKLIKDNPDFDEKVTVVEIKPLQEYLERLNSSFQSDSKRLLNTIKENNITGLIEKCFGNVPLPTLEGYNDTINTAIQNLSAISFDWIKPMQLLKAFTEMYFETHYKTFLHSLLVEGCFANKQIESQYASVYRSCETFLNRIRSFEQLFQVNGQCNLQQIKGYIAEIEKGKDLKKQLHKIIEIANMQAHAIVQTGCKIYGDLYAFVEHLLADLKAPIPEVVTNLMALSGSSKNKESFSWLEQDRLIFAQFLEIMKNYTVVDSGKKEEKSEPSGQQEQKQ